MTDTITTRNAGVDDVPGIVSLLNAAFAMEWDFINRERTSAPEIAQYMTTGTFFVVDGEGEGIGACMYLEQRGPRLYLGMLAVSPAVQGRGLGKQMMTAALRHAASLGCETIDIRIVNRRTELPPFYRSLGFVDNGTEPFEDPLLTKPCHFIRMAKKVR